jgi:uncharacterized protein YicC (UPF0701 family)
MRVPVKVHVWQHSLKERLAQLRKLATQAQPLVPQLVEQQKAKFLERWRRGHGFG